MRTTTLLISLLMAACSPPAPAWLCTCEIACGHTDGTVGHLLPRKFRGCGVDKTEAELDGAAVCRDWIAPADCTWSTCEPCSCAATEYSCDEPPGPQGQLQ